MAASVEATPTIAPLDSQATPKAKSSTSPVRIDWASMKSDFSSEDTTVLDDESDGCRTPVRPATPEPGSSKRKRSITSNGSSTDQQKPPVVRIRKTHDRVYDVPTLMRYRNSLAGLTVFAKIRPEALSANLFSHMGAGRNFIPQPKSRGFSEFSNRSRNTLAAPPPIFTDGPAMIPDMSHQHPPQYQENNPTGRRDGFVRFLKQHASPPHNRVTAGGRIVPAGPNSPPPMFNFESLTGMAEQKRKALQNDPLSAPPGLAPNLAGGWPRSRLNGLEEAVGPSRRYQNNIAPMYSIQQIAYPQGGHFIPPTPQTAAPNLSTALVPVGTFEDGSYISVSNGTYFRTYWNGMGFVMEPLSFPAAAPPFTAPAPLQPPMTAPIPQMDTAHRGQTSYQRVPLANTINRSSTISSADHQVPKTAQLLDAQQRNLKEELHKLDRHLALNHYQLSQDQKNQFIAQRRSLIEDIDNIRRVREPSAPDLPIIDVRELAKRAKDRNSKSRSGQQSSGTGDDLKLTSQPLQSNEKPKKALSPNAVPFVPAVKAPTPITESQALLYGNASSTRLFKKLPQAITMVTAPLATSKMMHEPDTSLDRDPEDPAMRIVHNSDIAYASKFEHDVIDGRKKYCSNVNEFQEALRRVRQQARLYGCAGGSSKDPAYDAEQDIWWAICDKDPIPLPQDPPDHVVDPRPWDWNDSAFNHRCISKAARREAVSLRSVSGTSTDLPRRSKQAQESLNSKIDQVSTKQPVPDKTLRALQEVRNPPGPKVDSSHDQHGPKPVQSQPPKVPSQDTVGKFSRTRKAVGQSLQTDSPAAAQSVNHALPKGPKGHRSFSKNGITPPRGSQQSIGKEVGQQSVRGSSLRSNESSNVTTLIKPTNSATNSYREKPRGPKKTKSKQQLRDGNSLRRHRQALHQAQTAKRPSILNFQQNFKPESIHSAADINSQSEVSSQTTQSSFLSRTGQQLSPRGAARKALQLYDRSRTKSPLKPQPESPQPQPQRARVNLPALAHAHLKNKFKITTTSVGETKPVAPTTPSRDSFLRDMLRGARYSSKKATPAKKDTSKDTASRDKVTNKPEAVMEGNKENASTPVPVKSTSADLNNPALLENDIFTSSKAPSSLAASSLQAIGFLPQFDGAVKARTSKIQQEHGVDLAANRKPKVNLPHQDSSLSAQAGSVSQKSASSSSAAATGKAKKSLTPSIFGFDGSGDDRPSASETKADDDAKAAKWQARAQEIADYDTRGLTEEDFIHQRTVEGGVKSPEHCERVDKFFEEVAKEEREEIERVRREQEEGRGKK